MQYIHIFIFMLFYSVFILTYIYHYNHIIYIIVIIFIFLLSCYRKSYTYTIIPLYIILYINAHIHTIHNIHHKLYKFPFPFSPSLCKLHPLNRVETYIIYPPSYTPPPLIHSYVYYCLASPMASNRTCIYTISHINI